METVSKEIYEEIKTQVLAEIEERKLKDKKANLAAEAVFAQAKRKYLDKLAVKYRKDENDKSMVTAWYKFTAATKLALELVGARSAKSAYLNGYADEANKKAEQILEAILKEE